VPLGAVPPGLDRLGRTNNLKPTTTTGGVFLTYYPLGAGQYDAVTS
jgi:hypothetical protein